jgi:hypothetical protein
MRHRKRSYLSWRALESQCPFKPEPQAILQIPRHAPRFSPKLLSVRDLLDKQNGACLSCTTQQEVVAASDSFTSGGFHAAQSPNHTSLGVDEFWRVLD